MAYKSKYIDLDLTGQRFGKLTAIKKSETKKARKTAWECYCDCGNTSLRTVTELLVSNLQTCGKCHRNKDLTEKRFGGLIVLFLDHFYRNLPYWNCKCDCGNTAIVRGSSLASGYTRSCGCRRILAGKMKLIDLTNKKFGRWTVLSLAERPENIKSGIYWNCICDCGNPGVVRGANLANGQTTSCGCYLKDLFESGLEKANVHRAYMSYKKSARNKSQEFELTEEDFLYLAKQNCFYCNTPPSNMQKGGMNSVFYYSGMDRVDNTRGYTLDNTVPCCKECNIGKKAKTKEEFLNWIKRIYTYSILNKNEKEYFAD